MKLFLGEVLALAAGLAWFFYFSPVFEIMSVQVQGSQRIEKTGVKDAVWQQTRENKYLFGSQKNIFFFSSRELAETFKKIYYLEEVKIEKKMPDKIIVNLREKGYAAIWSEAGKNYFIGEEGRALREADLKNLKKNYAVIQNKTSNFIEGRKIDGEERRIKYILELFEELTQDKIYLLKKADAEAKQIEGGHKTNNENSEEAREYLGVDNFILTNDKNTVEAKTAICGREVCVKGPIIYFNAEQEARKQARKLTALIQEKIKKDFAAQEYIDLRYGERIYYK